MCGIVGYITRGAEAPSSASLDEAVDLLTHRGPDDRGVWRNAKVGLGMRRLSIQDLSQKGHQPMWTEDGRFVIVYNGEIYNFKELRSDLEKQGEHFTSGTDTEVLLRLYAREREACLEKLNGMFAFAVYDTQEDALFLARDRFGIKPLYLLHDAKGLYFASETKALLPFVRELDLPWQLDQAHLFEYLTFRYVAGHRTLLKNLVQCKPGFWMRVDASGTCRAQCYYDLSALCASLDTDAQLAAGYDERAYVEVIKEQLKRSIDLRMISDAPLGVALSGGVDSSLITALLREMRDEPIDTYSVVFEEKEQDGRAIDESPFSDHVAERYGTNHHRLTLTQQAFADIYEHAIWHNDDPLNIPNSLGVYLFSHLASQNVKVLLGGEGADEAFAGYAYFAEGPFEDPFKNRLTRPEDVFQFAAVDTDEMPYRRSILAEAPRLGTNREIYYNLRSYLLTIENRLDKMSMANGLEMRVPFLDHHVVEASLALPSTMKVRGDVTKVVLKKLAEQYLPHEQIYRPKVGFSTPINKWLRDPKHLGRYVHVLEEERTLSRPIYKRAGIRQLLRCFREQEDTFAFSHAGRIWLLLNLEMWLRTFVEDKRASRA